MLRTGIWHFITKRIDHAWHPNFLAYLRNRLRDETIDKIKPEILTFLNNQNLQDNYMINKKERFGATTLFEKFYLPKQSPLGLDTWQLLSENVFWFTFGARPLALFTSTTLSCALFS